MEQVLSKEIITIKARQKFNEMKPLLEPIIEQYYEEYEIEYIRLNAELIFIPDFDVDTPYKGNEDD